MSEPKKFTIRQAVGDYFEARALSPRQDARLECVRIASSMTSDPDRLLDLADDIFQFVLSGSSRDVIPCGTEDDDAFTLKCEGE